MSRRTQRDHSDLNRLTTVARAIRVVVLVSSLLSACGEAHEVASPPAPAAEQRVGLVSAGGSAACAVTALGDTYCWGLTLALDPTLGHGFSEPIRIRGVSGATAISADATVCTRSAAGVQCWCHGGVVGPSVPSLPVDGSFSTDSLALSYRSGAQIVHESVCLSPSPLAAPCPLGALWIDRGSRAFEITPGDHQLTDLSPPLHASRTVDLPVAVAELAWGPLGLIMIRSPDGEVWAHDGTDGSQVRLMRIPTPRPIASLGTSAAELDPQVLRCMLDSAGEVWCVGVGCAASCGPESLALPTRIEGLPPMASVTSGAHFACGLDQEQHVWCWGANDQGQLGNGTMEASWTPSRVVIPN